MKLDERKTTHGTQDLLKAGVALVLLAWLLLVVWTLLSWFSRKVDRSAPGYVCGTKVSSWLLASLRLVTLADPSIQLILAVACCLPLIAVRVIYAAISLILDVDGSRSGFPSSRTAKIIMSVVPEMLVASVLITVGIVTRNIQQSYSSAGNSEERYSEQMVSLESKP